MTDVLGKKPLETAFLAGAGISIPPPSSLPGAVAFISTLVAAVTDDKNLQTSLLQRAFQPQTNRGFAGDYLRFEAVMSCVRNAIDPQTSILRAYSDCTCPNAYHSFLAMRLAEGAIVLTTNFDNLIEIACSRMGVEYSLIVSAEELDSFVNHPDAVRNPVIKLHGGYDATDSGGKRRTGPINIKTTLEDVGRVYLNNGLDPLAAVLRTVMDNRHLIVMGYSGCDDFDVMPCLLGYQPPRGLTWIDHDNQPAKVVLHATEDLVGRPPYRLLARHENTHSVSILRGNTGEILGISVGSFSASETFNWTKSFDVWKETFLKSEAQQHLVLGHLLVRLERYEESLRFMENIPLDALSKLELEMLYYARSCIYVYLNDAPRAILSLAEIADSEQQVAGVPLKGFAYYNLARVNTSLGSYGEARSYLNAAFKIFKEKRDLSKMFDCLHEMGRIEIENGNYEDAVRLTKWATEASEKLGDLTGAAIGFLQMARAITFQHDYDKAEAFIRRAINIFTLNGNQQGLGMAHHGLGYLFAQQGAIKEAAVEFQLAIEYERRAGARLDVAHSLHALGDMYIGLGELEKACDLLKQSIMIKQQISDHKGIANSELLLRLINDLWDKGEKKSLG